MLKEPDQKFLQKRRGYVKSWNIVGTILLLCLLAVAGWLFVTVPELVNPVYVQTELKNESIEISKLQLMAAMLPIVVVLCFVLTGSVIFFGFVTFANERQYLRIIDELNVVSETTKSSESRKDV